MYQLGYLLIFFIAVISNYRVAIGQFTGEDEALQFFTSSIILDNLSHFHGFKSLFNIIWHLSAEYHPPLRFILSLPGMLLFPHSEFGLRFVSWIFSFLMTYQAVRLGKQIGGNKVGLFSGLLIACSGVYNWTSMAFGWSITVYCLLASIRLLLTTSFNLTQQKEVSVFRKINCYVMIAFLINTGNILFFLSTFTLYFFYNYKNWKTYCKHILPFLLFYVIYYSYFLWFTPWFGKAYLHMSQPFGQLFQNTKRSQAAHVNFSSLIENLRGLNAYFFPFISWIFFSFTFYFLYKNYLKILFWISLFLAAWSFYIIGNSQQYFILACIAVLPFGVLFWNSKLPSAFMVLLCALCLVWNFFIFTKPYQELDFPKIALNYGFAEASRKHNILFPYNELMKDLSTYVTSNEKFILNISNSFYSFYYPSPSYLEYTFPDSTEEGCLNLTLNPNQKIKAVVTEIPLCKNTYSKEILYSKSNIKLYLIGQIN